MPQPTRHCSAGRRENQNVGHEAGVEGIGIGHMAVEFIEKKSPDQRLNGQPSELLR